MTLSELLGLPSGLTDAERGACISLANHYGAEAAQAKARKIMHKKQAADARRTGYDDTMYDGIDTCSELPCQCDECRKKYYEGQQQAINELTA